MEVHRPLQFLASIVKAHTMTKLRKVLNSPPTKHCAHLVVKQHFLSRFVSSGMLLSSFPSQNSFTRVGWTSEHAGSTLQCCSDAARSTSCSTLSYSLTVKSRTPFSLFVSSCQHLVAPYAMGGSVHAPVTASSRVSDDRPPIGDPVSPIGMVRRPPWSMAITTYPTTISSPLSPQGPNASKGVDRVSFCVAMLRVRRRTGQCSCTGEWMKLSFGSLGLNYQL